MTRGPERLRLDAALAEADEGVVQATGVAEWRKAAMRLDEVVIALRTAANSGSGIGGRTGPAMFEAMRRSADNLQERVGLFREGVAALESAATTIEQIRTQRREALREQRAREIADQFDRRYDEPIAVMKKIHGIPDPDPADSPRGPGQGPGQGPGHGPGGRATAPRGGSTLTGPAPVGPTQDPDHGAHPSIEQPAPRDPTTEAPSTTTGPVAGPVIGPPSTATPVLSAPDPGVASGGPGPGMSAGVGVGVGLGGGALLGGLAKGVGVLRGLGAGALAGGQPTRPLGGLSRSGVSGTLGRPSAAGAPVAGRPVGRGGVGAAASAGRTSGARTGGVAGAAAAGGRGGACAGASGGRGAVGVGGGARARSADRRTDPEHYADGSNWDDGSDWLDDDAAPSVLS